MLYDDCRVGTQIVRAFECGASSAWLSQLGGQFAFEELEKPVLARADLGQDDVIKTSSDVIIDRLEMALS